MWNHLPPGTQSDEVDFLHVTTRDRYAKWGKLAGYYPAYVLLAIHMLRRCRTTSYDVIIAWESKNGFVPALMQGLFKVRLPPLVILAFSYKGIADYLPWLGQKGLSGSTYVTVTSPAQVTHYRSRLNIPANHISLCPLGWEDMFRNVCATANTPPYIFSGGRSYRDYRTLFAAAAGLDVQFVVNTRPHSIRGMIAPPNVEVNDLMPASTYTRLVWNAQFVVLPLHPTPHAAGEIQIVQAMAAGKAIVATRTGSTSYYIVDGVTGILVAPNDPAALQAACAYLLAHPHEAEEMGRRARERYAREFTAEAMAARQYEVIRSVAEGAKS